MQHKQIISGSGLIISAALAIASIVFINTTITGFRLDLTENKLFTLSDGTINIIKSLEEPIDLEFYFSRKTLADFPQLMNYATRVRDLLEEYAAKSNGKILLHVIEPEPFSEEEDQAVASGMQGVSINTAGDRAYFGLVGTNSTDDQEMIPFFRNNREAALEYDITKLIYNLANPEKRVIGVISSLPVFGDFRQGGAKPWAIITSLREFFDVRNLDAGAKEIEEDIDVLMVIHPKNLNDETIFAIDQYLLGGGKGMFFVDPLGEADATRPDPANPMVMPDLDSDLNTLLDAWGLVIPEAKVAADINLAMRVQTRSPRGPQETSYLPWLQFSEENLNRDDFSTSELETINLGTAGMIETREDSTLTVTPLLETTTESMKLERDMILFQQDPAVMLNAFKPENKKLVIGARIEGKVKTAYPEGRPLGEDDETDISNQQFLQEGTIHAILIADTDILNDIFWVRTQNFLGIDIPQTIANNGDFVINAAENLSGNTDLVSLRSRGEFSRPFKVVQQIQREAEERFRAREQELQNKLEETEQKILALQRDSEESTLILSPEQAREIEKFKMEQIVTRKELRAVQHELHKNIEKLGTQLKFINIGLIPLLIILLAIGAVFYRDQRSVQE